MKTSNDLESPRPAALPGYDGSDATLLLKGGEPCSAADALEAYRAFYADSATGEMPAAVSRAEIHSGGRPILCWLPDLTNRQQQLQSAKKGAKILLDKLTAAETTAASHESQAKDNHRRSVLNAMCLTMALFDRFEGKDRAKRAKFRRNLAAAHKADGISLKEIDKALVDHAEGLAVAVRLMEQPKKRSVASKLKAKRIEASARA